jgi:heme exporter protein CcmD
MLNWLAMGGYWMYVWPAYAIALLGLVAVIGGAWRSRAQAAKGLAAAERNDE